MIKGFHNMRDMVKKGRDKHQTKITPEQAIEIMHSKDIPLKTLAKKFGITKDHVCRIRNGRKWKRLYESIVS
jgi:hypothetical protein